MKEELNVTLTDIQQKEDRQLSQGLYRQTILYLLGNKGNEMRAIILFLGGMYY